MSPSTDGRKKKKEREHFASSKYQKSTLQQRIGQERAPPRWPSLQQAGSYTARAGSALPPQEPATCHERVCRGERGRLRREERRGREGKEVSLPSRLRAAGRPTWCRTQNPGDLVILVLFVLPLCPHKAKSHRVQFAFVLARRTVFMTFFYCCMSFCCLLGGSVFCYEFELFIIAWYWCPV